MYRSTRSSSKESHIDTALYEKLISSAHLTEIALPTISYRGLMGDVIETSETVHGVYDIRTSPDLEFHNNVASRGHQFKLYKKACHTNTCSHYFTTRIVTHGIHCPRR
jgi:hypothetical protein